MDHRSTNTAKDCLLLAARSQETLIKEFARGLLDVCRRVGRKENAIR